MNRRVWLRTPGARIVAVGVAAILIAELAVVVLSPAQPGPQAAPVDPADYLAPAQIEQGQSYRSDTRVLLLIGLGVEFGALALFALALPRRARDRLASFEHRPLLGAAATGAALSVALAVLALPVGLVAHELAVDVGLSVQSAASWLFDRARSIAIGALYAAAGALLLVLLQRRLPRGWWIAGAGVIVSFAIVVSFLAPVAIAPIFNDFEPLEDGPLRSDVLELAERADVEVGEVYSVDASRRRTSLNAYIGGLGSTRRVVLYDNLIEASDRGPLLSVVAHELAHVKQNDIPRGILFVAIVAPLGMLFVRELGGSTARRVGTRPGRVAAIPAYALAISIASLALGLIGNQLSRAVEERADRFAIELTERPDALIEQRVTSARRNVSDPDPPGWYSALFGSHPSTVQRIGIAEAYSAESGRAAAR
jgi:STE24 endopeptidase